MKKERIKNDTYDKKLENISLKEISIAYRNKQ